MKNKKVLISIISFFYSAVYAASHTVIDFDRDLDKMKDQLLENKLIKNNPDFSQAYNPLYGPYFKGQFTPGSHDISSYLSHRLKTPTLTPEEKKAVFELRDAVSKYNDAFRKFDEETSDPRVVNAWRQDREHYLNLVKVDNDKASFDEDAFNQLQQDEQRYKRLMKEYKIASNVDAKANLRQKIVDDLKNEFYEKDKFDKDRFQLEKQLSQHALADSQREMAEQAFDDRISSAAKEQKLSESLSHASIRDLAIKLDTAERNLYDAEAKLYGPTGLNYIKKQNTESRKEFNIDKMYEDSINQYKDKYPHRFDKTHKPSLDDDMKKTYEAMENKALARKKSVRDLENSWLSNTKFYTVSNPYYHTQYYGNKLKNAVGLNSKPVQNVGSIFSQLKNKLYSWMPTLTGPVRKTDDELYREQLGKELRFKLDLDLLESIIKKYQNYETISDRDKQTINNIIYKLENSLVLRNKAKDVLRTIAIPNMRSQQSENPLLLQRIKDLQKALNESEDDFYRAMDVITKPKVSEEIISNYVPDLGYVGRIKPLKMQSRGSEKNSDDKLPAIDSGINSETNKLKNFAQQAEVIKEEFIKQAKGITKNFTHRNRTTTN